MLVILIIECFKWSTFLYFDLIFIGVYANTSRYVTIVYYREYTHVKSNIKGDADDNRAWLYYKSDEG